jgi:methionine-rich copper-binding protein CopC
VSDSYRRGPVLALAAALLALLAFGAAPALAHAELVSSDPADGAQLSTPPTTIQLTFSEGLDAAKSSFRLNESGTTIGSGKAAADGDTVMTLDGLALDPGDYVIRWTSAADDGHLERGVVQFTVLQPAPASATQGPSPSVAPSPATSATRASSVAPISPSPQASSDTAPIASFGSEVLLPIVLALLVVAAAGAFLLRRSRRI